MSGNRQKLLLIPGSLCDERVWQHQLRDLADVADMQVASIHGQDSLAGMAKAALDHAPEGGFALAGFSMGGRVALEMFRLAPERITRLALLDSSVHLVAPGEAERRAPQIEKAKAEGMDALVKWWNPKIAHPSRRDDQDFLALLDAMACAFTPEEYEIEAQALLNRPDPRDLLGRIAVPVLVLAGEDDPISGPERNAAIAEAIPGAVRVNLPDTGHFPMLERPEAVTAAMRDWLAA